MKAIHFPVFLVGANSKYAINNIIVSDSPFICLHPKTLHVPAMRLKFADMGSLMTLCHC